jgi:Berberine and berberine like
VAVLFWGSNYAMLLAVEEKYDPDGLFFVHRGVGSERWSADGFTIKWDRLCFRFGSWPCENAAIAGTRRRPAR